VVSAGLPEDSTYFGRKTQAGFGADVYRNSTVGLAAGQSEAKNLCLCRFRRIERASWRCHQWCSVTCLERLSLYQYEQSERAYQHEKRRAEI
jgi:hypothetical protein